MRQRGVAVRAIVVSQSAEDVGLAETVEGLREFGVGEDSRLSPGAAGRRSGNAVAHGPAFRRDLRDRS